MTPPLSSSSRSFPSAVWGTRTRSLRQSIFSFIQPPIFSCASGFVGDICRELTDWPFAVKKEVKNQAIICTYICCSHSLVQTHLLLILWITSKLRIITASRLLWSSSMILLFWSDETTEARECLLVWWTCQQLEWNSAGTNASHAGNSSRVTPPLVERPQRWLHVITWNIYFFLSVKHCGYRVTCLFSCGLHFEKP